MKYVSLTLAALLSFNFANAADAAAKVRATVIIGVGDKFAENDFSLLSPNGTDGTAIDCSWDKYSQIEVDELEHGHWVHYGFKSHKECVKVAKAAEKASAQYPAVIVLIDGIPTLADY